MAKGHHPFAYTYMQAVFKTSAHLRSNNNNCYDNNSVRRCVRAPYMDVAPLKSHRSRRNKKKEAGQATMN